MACMIRLRRSRAVAAGIFSWLIVSICVTARPLPSAWIVSEFQPDILNGGRANTIAVHPTDTNYMFVASESGGLFATTDGGHTWQHVDSLPVIFTQAVAFMPARPNIVIVTAGELGIGNGDFGVANGAGIWRSENGGTTWTHIPDPVPPAGVTDRFSAREI